MLTTVIFQNYVFNWIRIILYFSIFTFFSIQYFMIIPYFNKWISTVYGVWILATSWVYINGLITLILHPNGNLLVILICIPLIFLLVNFVRKRRIYLISISTIEDIKSESDLLIKLYNFIRLIIVPKFNDLN